MKSRERVLRALEFDHPDRVPRDLWTLPWAEIHHPKELAAIREDFPVDIINSPVTYSNPPKTEGDPHLKGTFVDEWGCEFLNLQDGVIGEVKRPIVEDWQSAMDKVKFPLGWLKFDRDEVDRFCREEDRFVIAHCCPRAFERLQFLRGSENFYMDLADPPAAMEAFIQKLHGFYCDLLSEWAKTDVDALMIMDDWGSQSSLLINPKTWRKFFKPLYRDYIRIAHEAGKKIFMHSDGFIVDIIEDLVELGLDALNSQVFCMGFDRLSPFKGNLTFWGEMDRQHLLPNGTKEEIRSGVREFHHHLYSSGGVIAQCEFGLAANPENIREMYLTWDELTRS
ncbi:MAG: methyltransferase [Candidatus Omnitrophica bacterium]|nr:methyltransferase [Candidatus Omnitrophota bacterium]